MNTETAPFTLKIRVRYGECDAQQVVFNARYADYVDLAVTEYVRALFPDKGFQCLFDCGLDTQVVRLDLQWQSAARFDDVLSIAVTPARIGTTSYALTLDITQAASGTAVAVAEITYVLVSLGEHRKTRIPDWLREQLASGAPGIVINQSGA